MIRFAHPWVLFLLLLLPLWLWARLSPKLLPALHFSRSDALNDLPRTWPQRLHWLPHVLANLGMTLLIVALARPQLGMQQRTVTAETIDIVMVIDVSSSMEAVDFATEGNEKNRLDAVKEVARDFIAAREGDRIGLIAFSGQPFTMSPLTRDHDWLLQRVDDLATREMPDGTAIGTALASGVNRLRDSDADTRLILLLTDGINNTGDITPLNAAHLAAKYGFRTYVIGAGSTGPVRFPFRDPFGRTIYRNVEMPIDDAAMEEIAGITGGKYFRVQDIEEMEAGFAEIDALERSEIEMTEYMMFEERFMAFALAGLGLLLLERLLSATRLGRTLS
ncbi:MAG: VWA domain-containing protein [Verrucomicrobia bacterium]|nr:VWA domain-containing protein [Verrucomicrobiota bacterium]MCH8514316.1 VWA domain-containing protein [Kiritimatiellia bacterium]